MTVPILGCDQREDDTDEGARITSGTVKILVDSQQVNFGIRPSLSFMGFIFLNQTPFHSSIPLLFSLLFIYYSIGNFYWDKGLNGGGSKQESDIFNTMARGS